MLFFLNLIFLFSIDVQAEATDALDLNSRLSPVRLTCDEQSSPKYFCGKDVTSQMDSMRGLFWKKIQDSPMEDVLKFCDFSLLRKLNLDVTEFYKQDDGLKPSSKDDSMVCLGTVTYQGSCYYDDEINYMMVGIIVQTCNEAIKHRVERPGRILSQHGKTRRIGGLQRDARDWYTPNSLEGLKSQISAWSKLKLQGYFQNTEFDPKSRHRKGTNGLNERLKWAEAGWKKDPSLAESTHLNSHCLPSEEHYSKALHVRLPPYKQEVDHVMRTSP